MNSISSIEYNPAHHRVNIKLSGWVEIVTKRNQRTGITKRGQVRWILTSAEHHTRGIKVMLHDRTVGRVKTILSEPEESQL
jgi:uncharacterized repeat protein (TIGR03833 family)